MNISICVKSGTGGYYDYDGCDLIIKEIDNSSFPIPRINETIEILENNDKGHTNSKGEILKEYHEYLVRDVRYWISDSCHSIKVYVVPIGRNI